MPSIYTGNLGLDKPNFGSPNWNVDVDSNWDDLDALAPIGNLAVRPAEIPSASLNVRVSAGEYPNSDGSKGTFAGASSQAIPSGTTTVLFLDLTASGALTLASSYPTSTAHVPLATVVAGSTTITSIQDDRVPGGLVLRTLVNAADDPTAAGLGVAVGALYRNGSVVMIRVS